MWEEISNILSFGKTGEAMVSFPLPDGLSLSVDINYEESSQEEYTLLSSDGNSLASCETEILDSDFFLEYELLPILEDLNPFGIELSECCEERYCSVHHISHLGVFKEYKGQGGYGKILFDIVLFIIKERSGKNDFLWLNASPLGSSSEQVSLNYLKKFYSSFGLQIIQKEESCSEVFMGIKSNNIKSFSKRLVL